MLRPTAAAASQALAVARIRSMNRASFTALHPRLRSRFTAPACQPLSPRGRGRNRRVSGGRVRGRGRRRQLAEPLQHLPAQLIERCIPLALFISPIARYPRLLRREAGIAGVGERAQVSDQARGGDGAWQLPPLILSLSKGRVPRPRPRGPGSGKATHLCHRRGCRTARNVERGAAQMRSVAEEAHRDDFARNFRFRWKADIASHQRTPKLFAWGRTSLTREWSRKGALMKGLICVAALMTASCVSLRVRLHFHGAGRAIRPRFRRLPGCRWRYGLGDKQPARGALVQAGQGRVSRYGAALRRHGRKVRVTVGARLQA